MTGSDAQAILGAAVWVGSAGAVCATVVQLVKIAFASAVDEPRLKVATAAVVGLLLTLAFALSNGLYQPQQVYALIVAWVTISATGAGLQSAITATVTNRPT